MIQQIWISPVVEQILNVTEDGAAYHGYWAKDIFQLNANFGTVDDLKDLSDELHARGMVSLFPGFGETTARFGIPDYYEIMTICNV